MTDVRSLSRRVALVVGLWLAAAVAAGVSGRFRDASALTVGATTVGLLSGFAWAWMASPPFRGWALGLDLRWLTWFHVWRVVDGVGLLVLYDQHRLPWRLAGPAGLGELAMALTAPVVARLTAADTAGRLGVLFAWHALGAANLLSMATTGLRLILRGDPAIVPATTFPLSLIPTFLGPLALLTHAVALARIWSRPLAPNPARRP